MRITNNIRRRVMKMAHVRMRVDHQLFGEVKGDFAYYLRGSWVSVKEELQKAEEEAWLAEVRRTAVLPTKEVARRSFEAGLRDYHGVRGRYYGD